MQDIVVNTAESGRSYERDKLRLWMYRDGGAGGAGGL